MMAKPASEVFILIDEENSFLQKLPLKASLEYAVSFSAYVKQFCITLKRYGSKIDIRRVLIV